MSYYFVPVFRLFLSLLIWIVLPYLRGSYSLQLGLLFFWEVSETIKLGYNSYGIYICVEITILISVISFSLFMMISHFLYSLLYICLCS